VIVHERDKTLVHYVDYPVISRDVHHHEIRRLIQPVNERVALPTRHLADIGPGRSLVEVSAEYVFTHLANTHERLVLAETPVMHTYTLPMLDASPVRTIYVETPDFLADYDGNFRPHSTIGVAL
jgi:hypothetical protein